MKLVHILLILFIILSNSPTLLAQTELIEVWEPQAAGRFYPDNETILKDQINSFF